MPNIYNSSVIALGSSGGAEILVDNGPIYEGKYRIRYFDVDGTILKIEYVANGGRTTPPNNPSYDANYLIFDEWNFDIENYIIEQPTDIGAIYKTVNEVMYMFCRFTANTGLTVTLNIRNHTSIDWGDGIINTATSHTYANDGEYVIKISGNITLSTSSSKALITPKNSLYKLYFNLGVTVITDYGLNGLNNLSVISLSKTITTIKQWSITNTNSLKHINIPKNLTVIDGYNLYETSNIQHIILSQNKITSTLFNLRKATGLKSLIIPKGYSNFGYYMFEGCTSLKELYIPTTMTNLMGSTSNTTAIFYSTKNLTNLFITASTVPTLSANAFIETNPALIIWVNDDIIEQLKVATNWAAYATYMKPLSWYPSLTNPNA